MKTSKTYALAPKDRKDQLFADFFERMVDLTSQLEGLMSVSELSKNVFSGEEDSSDEVKGTALRRHNTWRLISALFDYAQDGVAPTSNLDVLDNVVEDMWNRSNVLVALFSAGTTMGYSQSLDDVLRTADARRALDEGEWLLPEGVALLGGVDLRTVRNAMSSGALLCDSKPLIENQSARAWLMGRKSYKPTVPSGTQALDLKAVRTPTDFAIAMRQQRERREREIGGSDGETSLLELLPAHPGLTPEILAEAEAGLFRAPLSVVWQLADVYGLPRSCLLVCVMRVFFPKQLEALNSVDRPANVVTAQEQ